MKSAHFFCTEFEGKLTSLWDGFGVVKCVKWNCPFISKFTCSNLCKTFIQSDSNMVAENIIKFPSYHEIDNDLFTFSVHVPGLYVHNSLVNAILPIKI